MLKYIIYYFSKLLSLTYSYKFYNVENLQKAKDLSFHKGTYFMALWHQNLMGTIFAHGKAPHCVLVSPSKDGELVAYSLEKLKHHCIRGSSHRQFFTAMKQLLRIIATQKIPCAITVDAPKGPLKSVKRGIVDLAKSTQSSILPTYAISKKHFVFKKSWDQFRLPMPFTTIRIYYGEPIIIPKETLISDYHYFTALIHEKLMNLEESFPY